MSVHPPGVGSLTVSSSLQQYVTRHCALRPASSTAPVLVGPRSKSVPHIKLPVHVIGMEMSTAVSSCSGTQEQEGRCFLPSPCGQKGGLRTVFTAIIVRTFFRNVVVGFAHVSLLIRVKGGAKGHIHDTTQFVLELTFVAGL